MAMKKRISDKELKKLQEAYPMVGSDYSDFGWTLLTEDVLRDLSPMVQDRMQDIAFYLYDANPLAHRIIEMTKDFIVGDGFTYKAKEKDVQKVLDAHWNDPVNNWEIKQFKKALELGLYGEQFYPVFVNPFNGHVKLGYIDPTRIQKVVPDKKNPEILREVILKANRKGDIKHYKVINPNTKKGSKDVGLLEGEIFVFTINNVTNSTRGRSDLLCLADWIDGYDQFLFARLERANILNNYVWDVLLEGADEPTLKKWLETQSIPKPGSIRAHNEKVKWSSVVPKLEGNDASNEANLFKMQILGGAGFPNLWFGEGGETIRAGAQEMSLPTLKHLQNRQLYFKFIIKHIFNFVIDRAKAANKLSRTIDTTFEIFSPPLIKQRSAQLGVAAGRLTDAIKLAQDNEWITKEQAKQLWTTFMKDAIGLDVGGVVVEPKEIKK